MRRNPGEAQRQTFRRPLGRHFGRVGAEPPPTKHLIKVGDGAENHEKHPPIFLLHMAIGKELVGQK